MKKSFLLLLSIILSLAGFSRQTVTYDTVIGNSTMGNWPAKITRHVNHWQRDSVQGIIFWPGAGQIGNDVGLLDDHGPHYIMNTTGWNGSVVLGNGTHYPVIISLQPPNGSVATPIIKQHIDIILNTFKIRRNGRRGTGRPDLHFSGISRGGNFSLKYVTYKTSTTDNSFANQINSMWLVQGEDAEAALQGAQTIPWPKRYGWWSKNFGGRLVYFRNYGGNEVDRKSTEYVKAMNDSMPGSAVKVITSLPGNDPCGHCMWDEYYRLDRIWVVGQPDVDSVRTYDSTGTQHTALNPTNMHWAQWLLRNGDTTLSPAQVSHLETQINGTNAVVYLPADYNPSQKYPLIYFRHGNGEIGSTPADVSKLYVWGPFAKDNGIFRWNQNWTFTVDGQTVKPIVIAHQVPFSYNYNSVESSKPAFHNASLNAIIATWSIDTNKICLTGVSAGGWGVMGYVSYSQTYANRIHAIAVVSSQQPRTATSAFTHRTSNLYNAGIRFFSTAGEDDQYQFFPYNQAVYDTLVTLRGASASTNTAFRAIPGIDNHTGPFIHDFYNPTYSNPALGGMDIYTWMLSETPGNADPVANAGNDQTITLPTNSVTVNASGSSDADGTIVSYAWTKVSGPSGGTIASPGSASTAISGLVAGSYVFSVTVTDDDGATDSDEITITVNPAPGVNKTINVTIDNVSNYFKDPAWNSWHVTGNVITGITSGTFKYSDGTMSGITAFMNRQISTNDNNTSYTGFTGLPDSALRYVSSHSNDRVLTIQGANNTKTYDITLYSSRNVAGFSSVFEYGGTNIPIATSGNKSAVATFTNITPVNGAFTINIKNGSGSTYNHLNAFVITEINGPGGSQFSVANTGSGSVPPENKKAVVRLMPNPVQQIMLANVPANDISLTIIDGSGRIVRNMSLQTGVHSINLRGLAAGQYQVAIYQKGKWIETQHIIKQ